MKIKLEAKCLRGAIDPGGNAVERHEDRMALDAICSAVPPEMISTLAVKESAKDAWESIRVMRIGDDRIGKTSARRVRRHVSTLTVEEITGRLLASEDDPEPTPPQAGGKLYLTEEQWLERYKQKEAENGRASSGSGGRGKCHGSKGKGRGGGNTETREGSGSTPGRNGDACRYCGKPGHWAKECRSWKRDQQAQQGQQAHVAQDDEPSLLLVHDAVITTAPPTPSLPVPAPAPSARATIIDLAPPTPTQLPHEQVYLVEGKVNAVLDDDEGRDPRRWIFDTGASNRMTGCRDAFSDLDTSVAGTVRFGDGSVVRIEGCGTILFDCKNGEHGALPNTYYIPRLTANIVSCGQLDEDFEILIRRGVMRVRDEQHRLLAKIRRGPGRLYVLDLTIARPVCLAARAGEDAWRWHARFGHTNFAALRKMGREGLVRGLPVLSSNRYFPLLVDDYSRFMWVAAPPGSTDAAPAAIKRIRAAAERKTARSRAPAHGAVHAAANGVVERRNQTVVGMAGSMIKAKGLPGMFWGEAINTAVYILNRTTSKGTGGKTPYELWNGTTPAVHHLRTFRCVAHIKNVGPDVKKLDDRSKPMIFIGYEPGSKAYRVYDPAVRRVHISRDVIFDEEARWEWGADTTASGDDEFVIRYTTVAHPEVTTMLQPQPREDTPGPSTPAPTPHAMPAPTPHATPSPTIKFATPPSVAEEDLDAEHDDDVPLRFRTVDNILGLATPRGMAHQDQDEDLLLTSTDEPTIFEQAQAHECWRKAMLDEMTSIEANGTWELVDPPPRQRPIGLKWVFKTKKDATGIITKHKARLVTKGYVQRQGIDYDEVFAPVARLESVRLLLALAASEGWPVHHMDVKSAFLNGELREEVYVTQPPGFIIAGKEQKVLRLIKALYGLRQAPRAWYAKLDASLASLGFQRSASEHAVYTRGKGAHRLIVGVYVDDLIITGGNITELKQFKEEMKSTFQMSDLGLLHYYLGLEVNRTTTGITISQGTYATKILEAAGLASCNASATPMETRLKLSKFSTEPAVDATEYRWIVGALRYLVNTRPDLAFAVGYVSRFMEKPTTEHLTAVKRILRYVAGTVDFGCHYRRKEGEATLLGYSDSDHGADIDGRKSTSGVLFFLGENIITWQSQKQKVVALSSCEAEYIAAATASCQGVWLARLLAELRGREAGAVKLNIDNQSAIQLSKNPVFHDRSKHIDVKFHYIRECIEEGSCACAPILVDAVHTLRWWRESLAHQSSRTDRVTCGVGMDTHQAHDAGDARTLFFLSNFAWCFFSGAGVRLGDPTNVTLRDTEMSGGEALRRLATLPGLRCLKLVGEALTEQVIVFSKGVHFEALRFLVVEGSDAFTASTMEFAGKDAAPKLEKIVWAVRGGGGSGSGSGSSRMKMKTGNTVRQDRLIIISVTDNLPSTLKVIELRGDYILPNLLELETTKKATDPFTCYCRYVSSPDGK
ncbi:hypothetical protein U9M48_029136, partial [Paspalum notatum var. saurae]